MDKFFYKKYGLREDDFKPKTIKEQFGQGVADTFDRIEKEQRAKERKYFDLNTLGKNLNVYQKDMIDKIADDTAVSAKLQGISDKFNSQLDYLFYQIHRDFMTPYYDKNVKEFADYLNTELFTTYIKDRLDEFMKSEEKKEQDKNDEKQVVLDVINKHLAKRKK